ncbi:bone morphogenetic protein 3 [Myxocyprinus asiaticus]|uniref:bone morphogenetic protein 3 n=1 Tax=Myxocyprinus asiaticus TaxID=70543 RepID=UPI0022228949|nr:bone morphogenetic protein 3 [Myxocyprinus asiaticus]
MDRCQRLFILLLGWGYLCCGYSAVLKTPFMAFSKDVGFGQKAGAQDKQHVKKTEQDTLSEHMQMLYTKYNSAGFLLKDGNTVRSFKGQLGKVNNKQLQIFNLTSLTKSEDVLSATLHYYIGDLQNSSNRCTRFKSCANHNLRRQGHIHLNIWSFSFVENITRTIGHFSINISTMYQDFISWQWKDITRVVSQAKHYDQLLIGIDIEGRQPWKKLLSDRSPYILVYANDSAISEPESVVSTLQRNKSRLVPNLHLLEMHNRSTSTQHRPRRSANILLPLQNNELPGPEYPYEIGTWDETSLYDPTESKPVKRPRKKPRKNPRHKNPLLQFDEQTIKKARKKQWNEPRNCARRYLKVDFADIGWSEWIISPKSFDAYYCSGSCQFPMPKSLKPSNHATIQSIVRAVGVVPGIPEPCCVPEKMSSLSILFFDEDKNVVLKVYPNMTVDSCACR